MSDRIKELVQLRVRAIEESRTLLDKAEKENRSFEATEKESYEKLLTEVDALTERIDRIQDQEKRELKLKEVSSTSKSLIGVEPSRATDIVEARTAMFRAYIKDDKAEYARLANENRDLSANVLTSGGAFMPPMEFVNQVIKFMDNAVFMRSMATKFTINAGTSLGFPTLETDPSDPEWTSEVPASAPTADTAMRTGQRELKTSPLMKLAKISSTLLRASAVPIDTFLAERLAYKFATAEENNYLNGNGNGRPLGLFTASAMGVSTNRDVQGGTTAGPNYDQLIDIKYSLKEQYWTRAAWIMHRLVQKILAKIKDGEGQYIWRPALTAGEPDMLLGSPVKRSEYAPSTMTANSYSCIFGDLTNYFIADSLNLEVQRLNEVYATVRQVGFLGTKESDGMPVLEEAFARGKNAAS